MLYQLWLEIAPHIRPTNQIVGDCKSDLMLCATTTIGMIRVRALLIRISMKRNKVRREIDIKLPPVRLNINGDYVH